MKYSIVLNNLAAYWCYPQLRGLNTFKVLSKLSRTPNANLSSPQRAGIFIRVAIMRTSPVLPQEGQTIFIF